MSMLSDAYTLHELGLATGADLDRERDIKAAIDDMKNVAHKAFPDQLEDFDVRIRELCDMRRPEFVREVEKMRLERARKAA
jgi:hypothetical protein